MLGGNKLFLLLTTSTLMILLLTTPIIQVTKVKTGDGEIVTRPDVKTTITLEYVHSVELGRVVETYEIINCEIKLTRLTWPGHGAGLPSTPSDFTNPVVSEGGEYVVENMSLHLGDVLTLSMKHRINPRLLINGDEIETGDLVEIRACTSEPLAWLLWQGLGSLLR